MNAVKLTGAGVLTAIGASLCCVTPVLALLAGSGSIASSFSEPARPYLIGITIIVLGLAWYQKLKPQPTDDCGCLVDDLPACRRQRLCRAPSLKLWRKRPETTKAGKSKFLQSKTFLLLVTLFAGLMISFPSYAKIFLPKNEKAAAITEKLNIQTVELSIKGMSCEACEAEVNHEVNKLQGIFQSTVSYENKNAIIKFDVSKTTIKKITDAVNATGYKVVNQSFKKLNL